MSSGIPYDSECRPRDLRRAHRDHDRHRLRDLGRDGGELGAFPGYKKNREHMLRVIRNHRRAAHGEKTGYEKHRARRRCGSTTPPASPGRKFAEPDRARHAGLGPGARARRGARLPQRAGHRGRADRHHRPGDGLRHHRHRARLRAGEVQEARRRRLLQDHQPRRAGGAARARLLRGEIAEIEAYAVGHGTISNAPGINHTTLKAKGFTDEAIAKVEKALPTAFDIKFAFNKWTLGEDFCRDVLGIPAEDLAKPKFDLLAHRRLHQARDRRRQHPCLRRDDGRGRAAPQGRALCGVRLRQSVRPHRQALSSRSRATSA